MGIKGVSGNFRPPRMARVRLGYKPKGETYPKDSDVFIGRIAQKGDKWDDGITKEMLEAYGKGRIDTAEGEVWSLGKSLRMLSYFEWDRENPQTGSELVVGLLNRAWSHSTLRCSGSGGDTSGEAHVRDETYMKAITAATHTKARPRDGGGWDIVCMGPKCPMWHTNSSTNKLATCHREMRFLAQLLHPTTNPEDPNYLRNLGSVEIVSGSFNGMIDVQSGLQMLREVAGRSFNVPFNVQRLPRTMLVDGKRLVKSTLVISFDNDEAIRFGYSDPKLSIVRPAVRKQLMAQRREMLELAKMEIDYDSVRDVVPRLEAPRSSESGRTDYPLSGSATGSGGAESVSGTSYGAAVPGDTVPDSSISVVGDRDQVVSDAVDAAEPLQLSEDQLNAKLSQQERNQLKELCGGQPGEPETLSKFFELVAAAHREFGTGQTPRDLSSLTVRHALWIKEARQREASE